MKPRMVTAYFTFVLDDCDLAKDFEKTMSTVFKENLGSFRDGSSVGGHRLYMPILTDPEGSPDSIEYLWAYHFLTGEHTDSSKLRFDSVLKREKERLANFGQLKLSTVQTVDVSED